MKLTTEQLLEVYRLALKKAVARCSGYAAAMEQKFFDESVAELGFAKKSGDPPKSNMPTDFIPSDS